LQTALVKRKILHSIPFVLPAVTDTGETMLGEITRQELRKIPLADNTVGKMSVGYF
jgi:hypothetical protein